MVVFGVNVTLRVLLDVEFPSLLELEARTILLVGSIPYYITMLVPEAVYLLLLQIASE